MFVTGCHRSGTSYLSGLLSEIIKAERSADINKTVDNPRGYFESTLIVPFNDNLLSLAKAAWDEPPLATINWNQGKYLSLASNYREQFNEYALTNNWIDKDPRLALTAPLFQHLLLKRVPYAVSLRSPHEVALSLYYRDGFSFNKGLLIWFLYNRHCSQALNPEIDYIFSYEDLVERNEYQLNALANLCSSVWPSKFSNCNLKEYILACHKKSTAINLRRNQANLPQNHSAIQTNSPINEYCLNLYNQLSMNGFDISLYKTLFAEIPSFIIDSYDHILAEGEPSLEYIRNHEIRSIKGLDCGISAECTTGSKEIDENIISTYSNLIESFHQLNQKLPIIDQLNINLQDESRISDLESQLAALSSNNMQLEVNLQNITSSFFWKISSPIRKLLDKAKLFLKRDK